jgi:hypothetical protein
MYLYRHPQAQGCHDDRLIGIIPLGRRVWFEDNEDMQAMQTIIIMINNALTVSVSRCVVVT